ncbi:hypothetical protein FRAAL6595 [Frankia alni ACN14a]|uniref:Uncharacterized protein n=1 Tax=Frankia alni (strain DSM 45986 / CECT 9034 / ACN14a) TaxID=326424 RepID=Q0RBG8_FRAAA|nr:hypothetical protein FRAAL6595 [Frankia alni ACN14a]
MPRDVGPASPGSAGSGGFLAASTDVEACPTGGKVAWTSPAGRVRLSSTPQGPGRCCWPGRSSRSSWWS